MTQQGKRVFSAQKTQKTWASLAPALLLACCAVGPDFHKTNPVPARAYAPAPTAAHDSAQSYIESLDIPGQWWTLFHAPQLTVLIDHALTANPNLQAAQAALRQARENVYAQEGSFFPSLSATFEPTRNKTATRSVSYAASTPTP